MSAETSRVHSSRLVCQCAYIAAEEKLNTIIWEPSVWWLNFSGANARHPSSGISMIHWKTDPWKRPCGCCELAWVIHFFLHTRLITSSSSSGFFQVWCIQRKSDKRARARARHDCSVSLGKNELVIIYTLSEVARVTPRVGHSYICMLCTQLPPLSSMLAW